MQSNFHSKLITGSAVAPQTLCVPHASQAVQSNHVKWPVKAWNHYRGANFPAIAPVFKTPKFDGPYRDEIVVEILIMNGKDFVGTVTPTEARRTIFEEMLGFTQADLAGVTIGYNRGRTVTYKLLQQVDIDELYELEYFDFERSIGQDVNSVSCKIRGVRDLSKRSGPSTGPARVAQTLS